MREDSIQIEYLGDYPRHIPIIAEWMYTEWKQYLVSKNIEEVITKLKTRLSHDTLPLCLIALKGKELVGTVTLKDHDLPLRKDLTPWLTSLYVSPQHRNEGIGAKLVRAVEIKARTCGIERIHLYTPSSAGYYKAMDWDTIEKLEYRGNVVTVMKKDTSGNSNQPQKPRLMDKVKGRHD